MSRFFKREFSIIPKKYRLEKPYALSIKGWKDWHSQTKKEYPVRYFLEETISDWYRLHIYYPLNRFFVEKLFWGFKHRFIKKHQYNIVRPSTLEPGYYDARTVLLHSSFHILSEFVEHEQSEYGHVLWTNTWDHTQAWYTMLQLYNWWTETYPNRESTLPDYPESPPDAGFLWALDDDYNGTPEREEWKRISDIRINAEIAWDKEDDNMLKKLAGVRQYMWN